MNICCRMRWLAHVAHAYKFAGNKMASDFKRLATESENNVRLPTDGEML
jgi:hypothetical protein